MASRNAAFHDGVLAGVLMSPLKLLLMLALGLLAILVVAWCIDWIFVFKVWPDGVDRLRALLASDLEHGAQLAARQGYATSSTGAVANLLYAIVFEATGIHDMGLRFADPSATLSIPDTIVRGGYVAHRDAIEAAMIGTQLLGVRIATLVRFAPLLALLYLAGTADGLAQRAIRRAGGGRESASLYHRAKYLQVTLLALGTVTLLVWPGAVAWQPYATLLVLGTAALARLQWTFYKKHL